MSKGKDKNKNKKKKGVFDGIKNMFSNKDKKSRKNEEGGLKRNKAGGSEGSLGSMDEREHVDDFFATKWSVPTHNQQSSPALKSKSKQKVDLNAVSTTSALSNEGAKHKLAVRQNNKRPRSQFGGRRPRSPTGPAPVSPLAKVTEEPPPRAESPVVSDIEDRAPTPDKDEELEKRHSIYPPKPSEKQSDSEPEPEEEVQPKPSVHHVTPEIHEVKPEVHEVKVEENKENVEPVDIKEEPKVEPEPEPKHEEPPPVKKEVPKKEEDAPPPSNPFGVVKLRSTGKRDKLTEHGTLRVDKAKDAAKRQTIAGDSAVHNVFAGSKVAQRSSVHEPKDWQKLDAQLESKAKKEPEPEAESDNSEFSKVFSKLRKRNSTNITALVEADQKSPDKSAVKESKPIVTETKPVVNREAKPVLAKEEPKPEPKRAEPKPEPKRADPPKSELKAEEPKTERPRSISPGATDSNKKTEKPVVEAEKPKDLDKTDSFKRDSPLLKDRERSKTIGTPPTTQKNETKSSPIVKRTHSQRVAPTTTPTSNAPQTTEPEKRPALKPAPARTEVKKPEESSNTGGQPSWMAMARKKTSTWDENRDPEKEMKEQSNKAKKEDDDEASIIIDNRKSKVMDLMKNFQNA